MGGWQLHQYINKLQYGAVAQLGERLPCKQEVVGSTPISSTIFPLVHGLGRRHGAGKVGSSPAWEELNELLVIEATNDNAQIENNSYGSFSRVCVRLSLVLDEN